MSALFVNVALPQSDLDTAALLESPLVSPSLQPSVLLSKDDVSIILAPSIAPVDMY